MLNLVLLWKTLTPHFRGKLKAALTSAFTIGADESDILASIKGMFDEDLRAYLDDAPTPTELATQYPEFEEMAAHLDEDAVAESAESLLQDLNPAQACDWGCVNIMSIHKSKGLQADVVFILGVVEGIAPERFPWDRHDRGAAQTALRRRPRAKASLHLVSWLEWDSNCVHKVDKSKFDYRYTKKCYYGRASRFITEMA